MIVAEHVKSAVHYQSQQFLSRADSLSLCVVPSDLRANIHVADHRSPASDPPESERYHVGCSMVAEVAAIKTRDCRAADECDREHCILHALGAQSGGGRLSYQRARHSEATHAGRN